MGMKLRRQNGQSTVEYIILFTAVIAVMIWFLGPTGPFKKAVNDTLNAGATGITEMSNRLSNSRPK